MSYYTEDVRETSLSSADDYVYTASGVPDLGLRTPASAGREAPREA